MKRIWAPVVAALVAGLALAAPGTARADDTTPEPISNVWCEDAPIPKNMALRKDNGLPYYLTAPYEPKNVYNPNSIANFVKSVSGSYTNRLESEDRPISAKEHRQYKCLLELGGNHLIKGSHTEGTGEDTVRWFGYRFDFSAHPSIPKLKGEGDGWFSGLAQGGALSAFVELDKHTNDPKWLKYGEQAFRSFDIPMDKKTGKGGITNHITVNGKDVLWFEEYPTAPATSVLNGHLEALIGLDIWFKHTGDQHAKDLVDEALDGLEPVLGQEAIDVQGGTLTTYDLMRGYWDKDRDYEASPLRLVSTSATKPTAFLNGKRVDIPVVTAASGAEGTSGVQARDGDVYTTPGYHDVNGRRWHTTCEKYSTTVERCRAEIWATQVRFVSGRYQEVTGWFFNNLTYKPSPRQQWEGNPLAANGAVGGKHAWTSTEGRQWKTECDTAETGRNGCRSFIMSKDIVVKTVTPRTYERVDRWVFNNIVQFSLPKTSNLTHDPHMNGPILATSSQPQEGWQQVVSGSRAVLDRGRVKVTTDGKGWQGVSQIIPADKITGKRLALSLNAELITPGNGTKKGVPGKVAIYELCPGGTNLVFESQKMRSRQKSDYTMSFVPRNISCNLLLQLMTASYGDKGTTIFYDDVELREADEVGQKFDLSPRQEPFKHLAQFVYDQPTNELTLGGDGTVEVQMYEDGRWQRLGKQRLTPGDSFSVEIPERVTGRNIHYGYHEHHVDELIGLYNRTKQDMDKDKGSKDREFLRTYALEWVKMAPSRIGKVPARYLPDAKARMMSVDDPGATYELPIIDPFSLLEDEWSSVEGEDLSSIEGEDTSSMEKIDEDE